MNSQIHLFLFNTKPRVELDGKEVHIPETSLDLLIYLAVENQLIHDREKLTQRLYETTADRDRLRQVALGNLDKEIKRICIRSSAPNTIGYDGSQVAVDVHEFTTLVTLIHENIPLTIYTQVYPQLLEAYELYNHHFLEGYLPASYGLNSWIRAKRTAFQEMFHGLLEKLVQYEIVNMRYEQAWMHAERWHQNLSNASLPLQYLIWLATNTDAYGQALSYLSRLEALSSSDEHVIGYSVEEWRRLFSRGIKPDIQALKLNRDARVEVAELINLASQRPDRP